MKSIVFFLLCASWMESTSAEDESRATTESVVGYKLYAGLGNSCYSIYTRVEPYPARMQNRRTVSLLECKTICDQEPQCGAFLMGTSKIKAGEKEYCYMIKPNNLFNECVWSETGYYNAYEKIESVVGYTLYAGLGKSCYSIYTRVEPYPARMQNRRTVSLLECKTLCDQEPQCGAFLMGTSKIKAGEKEYCYMIKPNNLFNECVWSETGYYNAYEKLLPGTIANWFYITSELNSQAIDIRRARKHEKNDVVMWRKTGAANQLWRWVGNMLVSKLNGMALTIRDGDRDKKATVWMMPREGSKEQQWRLQDGRLVSGLNGLVLDVKNGDKKRGNTVWMWEKNQSKAQKWKLQLAAGVKTVNYCTGEPGCCTEKYKCKELEGGCDNHDQCRGDLLCGNDNCPWPGWHWDGANCCTKGRYKCDENNPICRECTSDSPCARGFGDCDKDSECAGDLQCGDGNCYWDQHREWWYNKDDCCV